MTCHILKGFQPSLPYKTAVVDEKIITAQQQTVLEASPQKLNPITIPVVESEPEVLHRP
ncbi:hypothetical protein G7B40_034830 [Aetokthonos hydrillicola Thurmond2011]|jgi:hypothetical protein|uniref:Uncharacterized protein n=1 Tax=Aetokthonos hydrillicola Thurmond2011 TaxID=2712845 RepID=A0AAP5IGC5_9CYAN|nr:hypothetical protein [Aetokthonos hydrillicola]MBW4587053.1 hypothetical protein [Aetokthonos hydrillicola CCALA 1050]MDR9899697.1 hypothetical protein [Aetokthonos hydrillicola Thurmond2011]